MTIETMGDIHARTMFWLMIASASTYLLACIARYFIVIWAERGWRRGTVKAIVCPIAYEAIWLACPLLLLSFIASVVAGIIVLALQI